MLEDAQQIAVAKAAGKHHHEIAHLYGCRRKNCHRVPAICIESALEDIEDACSNNDCRWSSSRSPNSANTGT